MCEVARHLQMDSIRQNMLAVKNRLDASAAKTKESESYRKSKQLEKDSGICTGIFDPLVENFSVSRRSSAYSSGCSSVCSSIPTTPSPDITTASSAYSSATSSCCDSEAQTRRKSDIAMPLHQYLDSANNNNHCSRVPYHPELSAVPSSPATLNLSATETRTASSSVHFVASHRRINPQSCTSTKCDQSTAEDNRRLRDPVTQKTFEKRRLLGKGGFARVYEVAQLDQAGKSTKKRTCAAKVIEKSRLSRPQQREKVNVEVELLTEARGHPNVVQFLDSFEDDKAVCILLELCNKKSLAQYLKKKQSLGEQEVCNILQQVVAGLSHLHGKGIIHRDLKLGNILLTDDMQVKIGDFGLATRVEWGKKKTICGTPNFIAPEVLQRQGHGPEADVWALGCLLYTLLVGKPPFETYCLRETYRCILKNSYRIPSTVSSEASDLIRWMLRHKPKTRPTLSEISSHAFFAKHSAYLASLRPSAINQMTSSNESSLPQVSKLEVVENNNSLNVPEPSPANTSSDDKSRTLAALSTNDGSLTQANEVQIVQVEDLSNSAEQVTSGQKQKGSGFSSPVKFLASRLQKKLSKMPSPGKCVRAAATATIADGRKGAISSKQESSCAQENLLPRKTDTNQTCTPSATVSPKILVSKWVDYSNRYGFGYQLSNGRISVLFNDGKHISMLPGGNVMEYTSNETNGVVKFSTNCIPPCFEKYATMLRNFSVYMDRNLRQNGKTSSKEEKAEDARLITWCRTDDYIAMYFNDGTLQINSRKDHVKVSITSIHKRSSMRITIMDSKRNCTTYEGTSFASTANADVKARLAAIHQQFHSIFADVSCESHPFCAVCSNSCSGGA
ncbi:unnamed protein product [Clavelina lepadiformis]|uniref:Serine/threonine-protein kinase PLK n=1 Tax=Clavelina lepadiformis TaxID=159417 RepID=A0ABP0F901_CLALP